MASRVRAEQGSSQEPDTSSRSSIWLSGMFPCFPTSWVSILIGDVGIMGSSLAWSATIMVQDYSYFNLWFIFLWKSFISCYNTPSYFKFIFIWLKEIQKENSPLLAYTSNVHNSGAGPGWSRSQTLSQWLGHNYSSHFLLVRTLARSWSLEKSWDSNPVSPFRMEYWFHLNYILTNVLNASYPSWNYSLISLILVFQ